MAVSLLKNRVDTAFLLPMKSARFQTKSVESQTNCVKFQMNSAEFQMNSAEFQMNSAEFQIECQVSDEKFISSKIEFWHTPLKNLHNLKTYGYRNGNNTVICMHPKQ